MKKYFLFERLLIAIFVIIIFSYSAIAHDIKLGGQFNASLTGFYDRQLEFGYIPQANLDLELFLPPENNNEIKCTGYFYTNIVEEKVDFFWKNYTGNIVLIISILPSGGSLSHGLLGPY
jgi:hypothetical protein